MADFFKEWTPKDTDIGEDVAETRDIEHELGQDAELSDDEYNEALGIEDDEEFTESDEEDWAEEFFGDDDDDGGEKIKKKKPKEKAKKKEPDVNFVREEKELSPEEEEFRQFWESADEEETVEVRENEYEGQEYEAETAYNPDADYGSEAVFARGTEPSADYDNPQETGAYGQNDAPAHEYRENSAYGENGYSYEEPTQEIDPATFGESVQGLSGMDNMEYATGGDMESMFEGFGAGVETASYGGAASHGSTAYADEVSTSVKGSSSFDDLNGVNAVNEKVMEGMSTEGERIFGNSERAAENVPGGNGAPDASYASAPGQNPTPANGGYASGYGAQGNSHTENTDYSAHGNRAENVKGNSSFDDLNGVNAVDEKVLEGMGNQAEKTASSGGETNGQAASHGYGKEAGGQAQNAQYGNAQYANAGTQGGANASASGGKQTSGFDDIHGTHTGPDNLHGQKQSAGFDDIHGAHTDSDAFKNTYGPNPNVAPGSTDAMQGIVRDKDKQFKFSGEGAQNVKNAMAVTGNKLGAKVKDFIVDNTIDADTKEGLQKVKKAGSFSMQTLAAIGGAAVLQQAAVNGHMLETAGKKVHELIGGGKLTLTDLRASRKELKSTLKNVAKENPGLVKDGVSAAIVRNRQNLYSLYALREHMIQGMDAGQYAGLSAKTKNALRGDGFFKVKSKQMKEALNAYSKSSSNEFVRKLSKKTEKELKKMLKKPAKYGLSGADVDAVRTQLLIKKMGGIRAKALSSIKGLMRMSVFTIAALVKKADPSIGEAAQGFATGYSIFLASKAVVKLGVKTGKIHLRFLGRIGKRMAKFIDRHTGAITATKKALHKAGDAAKRAAYNSHPARAARAAGEAAKRARKAAGKAAYNSAPAKLVRKGGRWTATKAANVKSTVANTRAVKGAKRAAQKARRAADRARKGWNRFLFRTKGGAVLRGAGKIGKGGFKVFGGILSAPFKLTNLLKAAFAKVLMIVGIVLMSALAGVIGIILLSTLILTVGAGGQTTMNNWGGAGILSLFDKSITQEEIDADEAQTLSAIRSAYSQVESYADEMAEEADEIANGTPQNPYVYCNQTIDRYGAPDADGNWVNGSTIHYLDADGNEVTTKIDNTKDAVVMAYVIMQDDFFTDATGRQALVAALAAQLNPDPTYEESDIYTCTAGCSTMTYTCTDIASVEAVNANMQLGMAVYGDFPGYNQYGEYWEITCPGHKCYKTYEDGTKVEGVFYHNNGETLSGTGEITPFPAMGKITVPYSDGTTGTVNDTAGCSGYEGTAAYYCDADMCGDYTAGHQHELKVCYGHKDVDVYLQKYTMDDLFEDGYTLPDNSAYNSYINAFDGWNEENQDWAQDLKDEDWGELYGVYSGYAASGATGTPVALQLWTYLRGLGFSPASTAAIIGNAQQESGLDPSASGAAFGLFQFEMSTGNASGFSKYAADNGGDTASVTLQVDYLMTQLSSAFDNYTGWSRTYDTGAAYGWPVAMTLEEFKELDDPQQAAEIFERVYERARKPMMDNRKSYAQSYYDQYKDYDGTGSDIVTLALSYVGNPYVYGGNDLENGIDCSHFVWQILMATGHYDGGWLQSTDWANAGTAVASLAEAQPGDILVWSGHVAIYISDGCIVHASNSKPYPEGGIKVSTNVDLQNYHGGLIAIRRF